MYVESKPVGLAHQCVIVLGGFVWNFVRLACGFAEQLRLAGAVGGGRLGEELGVEGEGGF